MEHVVMYVCHMRLSANANDVLLQLHVHDFYNDF
jgi:hypothetical protein